MLKNCFFSVLCVLKPTGKLQKLDLLLEAT